MSERSKIVDENTPFSFPVKVGHVSTNAVVIKLEADDREILIQGRRLQFAACAAGAMRESFENLCGQALAAADYLAIARKFHTVFVDRIPIMSKANRNEAKRFVTLIDALYEHHVRLIASADGAPDELYPDGDGAFEFHRTASRLMEMQAEDYLSRPHRP